MLDKGSIRPLAIYPYYTMSCCSDIFHKSGMNLAYFRYITYRKFLHSFIYTFGKTYTDWEALCVISGHT